MQTAKREKVKTISEARRKRKETKIRTHNITEQERRYREEDRTEGRGTIRVAKGGRIALRVGTKSLRQTDFVKVIITTRIYETRKRATTSWEEQRERVGK